MGRIYSHAVCRNTSLSTLCVFKVPLHPNHVFFVFNMFLELINENHGVFFFSFNSSLKHFEDFNILSKTLSSPPVGKPVVLALFGSSV